METAMFGNQLMDIRAVSSDPFSPTGLVNGGELAATTAIRTGAES